MKERNPLDHIEPRGHDPGYDGRASRVSGGERFAPAVSRPKPLHWARILTIAGVLGGVLGAVGAVLASGDPAATAVLTAPLGVGTGLLLATALERRGVFRRVDEL